MLYDKINHPWFPTALPSRTIANNRTNNSPVNKRWIGNIKTILSVVYIRAFPIHFKITWGIYYWADNVKWCGSFAWIACGSRMFRKKTAELQRRPAVSRALGSVVARPLSLYLIMGINVKGW